MACSSRKVTRPSNIGVVVPKTFEGSSAGGFSARCGGACTNLSISLRVTDGASSESAPRAAWRIARTNSSPGRSLTKNPVAPTLIAS